MKYVLVCVLIGAFLTSTSAKIETTDGVLMLDASNIDEAFSLYDNLLVLFNQQDDEEGQQVPLKETLEF